MSTATLSSPSIGFSNTPRESAGQSIRRYSNMAATIALVLAVAVGGWLAMSQMTPGGDGRFAAAPGTPEAAQTCDVEPLTVDEVMAIVENPYSVAPVDYWGTPAPEDDGAQLAGEGLTESPLALRLPDRLTEVPDDTEFQKIHEAADTYLNCQVDGTVGQLMAVTHPESLQFYVLSNFPVYRDQETIRSFIEEVIDLPAIQVSPTFTQYPDSVSPQFIRTTASDDRNRVRVADHSGPSLLSDRIAYVGVDTLDKDGNVIGQTDWDATLLLGGAAENNGGHSLIMVYAEATDSWYVYGENMSRG